MQHALKLQRTARGCIARRMSSSLREEKQSELAAALVSAIVVQRLWRGFYTRRKLAKVMAMHGILTAVLQQEHIQGTIPPVSMHSDRSCIYIYKLMATINNHQVHNPVPRRLAMPWGVLPHYPPIPPRMWKLLLSFRNGMDQSISGRSISLSFKQPSPFSACSTGFGCIESGGSEDLLLPVLPPMGKMQAATRGG